MWPIFITLFATIAPVHPLPSHVRGGFTINNGQYVLTWEVRGGIAYFRAVAKGNGYVGFGLSPRGTMEASDLFLSGMHANGSVYAIDAHGAGEMDAKNNYELIHAMEGPSYTEVQFYRPLHTSDCADDIEIVNEPQYVIWSIGPDGDALQTHGPQNRGAVLVNLLNPPIFHSQHFTGDTKLGQNMGSMCPPKTN
ncbi:DBH-like monooxygenase protein 1 [Folsomia candida]|uniref:DBH-like monooxygenase protein 1 n=1 Tax=Folsomia candida TaxID=158441 RepID=UPI001604A437|nr:DBH-like monooxygenase protein 1 [Folsomia candida]